MTLLSKNVTQWQMAVCQHAARGVACMFMMPQRRSILGGVHQAGSITYANFDDMLHGILLVTIDHFSSARVFKMDLAS